MDSYWKLATILLLQSCHLNSSDGEVVFCSSRAGDGDIEISKESDHIRIGDIYSRYRGDCSGKPFCFSSPLPISSPPSLPVEGGSIKWSDFSKPFLASRQRGKISISVEDGSSSWQYLYSEA